MSCGVVVAGGFLLLLLGGGLTAFVPAAAAADVCDNVKQVATTLPKNISSSPLYFASTTLGQAPDVIYALALCGGDVINGTACNLFHLFLSTYPRRARKYIT